MSRELTGSFTQSLTQVLTHALLIPSPTCAHFLAALKVIIAVACKSARIILESVFACITLPSTLIKKSRMMLCGFARCYLLHLLVVFLFFTFRSNTAK